MLYEKCKEMLKVEIAITMNVLQLDAIRKALSLIDEQCLQLSLIDIERIWNQYSEWHGMESIPVNKSWIKRFLKWIGGNDLDKEQIKMIYRDNDKFDRIDDL